jgi:hypothetical protein
MPIRSLGAAAAACLLATAASAQIQRLSYVGDGAEHQLGRAYGGGRDINLDGKPDFIVGARGLASSATFSGRAYLFSGNGAFIRTFSGAAPGDEFGSAVALIGDVNGDGYPDIVVGARSFDGPAGANSGRAYVYRGESPSNGGDYALLTTLDGPVAGANFGQSAADVGDVDGDGWDDFAVGGSHSAALAPGCVVVYSGATLQPLVTLTSGAAGADGFGWAVAKAGDVDADGFGDLAVSAPGETVGALGAAGRVRIFRGGPSAGAASFAVLRVFSAEQSTQFFGSALAGDADQNGDGVPDLLVGSNLFDGPGQPASDNRGKAYLYSGADGAPLWSRVGENQKDWFGIGVATVGDIDGHGDPEFVVGACQTEKGGKGLVYAFVGTSYDPGFVLNGEIGSGAPNQGDALGFTVGRTGDLDGDGAHEFFVGAYGFDGFGGVNAGKSYVFSSAARCSYVDYPAPHVLKLRNIGWPKLGGTVLIESSGAAPFELGILGLAPYVNPSPFFGGTLFLDFNTMLPIVMFADQNGKFVLPIGIPTDSLFLGLTIHAQVGHLDLNQTLGVAHSNLLTLTTFL